MNDLNNGKIKPGENLFEKLLSKEDLIYNAGWAKGYREGREKSREPSVKFTLKERSYIYLNYLQDVNISEIKTKLRSIILLRLGKQIKEDALYKLYFDTGFLHEKKGEADYAILEVRCIVEVFD